MRSDATPAGHPAIHFYLSDSTAADATERLCCEVTALAFQRGRRVWINSASPQQVALIDELLWSGDEISFLPHARLPLRPGDPSPIVVGHRLNPPDDANVLINLDQLLPPFHQRFPIIVELVAGDGEERARMRERYRWYRQQGYTPVTHKPPGG